MRLMRWELALAGVVLATQTVSGQTVNTPQGWPGAAPQPAAAVDPAPKTPTPRPARKKPKPQPAVKVVAVGEPATVVPRAETDIVAALQQQSEVLSRLARAGLVRGVHDYPWLGSSRYTINELLEHAGAWKPAWK